MKKVDGIQRRMIVLLIRSQSGNSLLNLDNSVGIGITEAFDGVLIMCQSTTNEYKLGKYSSTEKALKVLDMIEGHVNEPIYHTEVSNVEIAEYRHATFKMPADEVEV